MYEIEYVYIFELLVMCCACIVRAALRKKTWACMFLFCMWCRKYCGFKKGKCLTCDEGFYGKLPTTFFYKSLFITCMQEILHFAYLIKLSRYQIKVLISKLRIVATTKIVCWRRECLMGPIQVVLLNSRSIYSKCFQVHSRPSAEF